MKIKIAIKSSGAQRAAKIGSGAATVLRANAGVDNAHALLLDENVTLMFAGIAGLGNHHIFMLTLFFHPSFPFSHHVSMLYSLTSYIRSTPKLFRVNL